MTSITKKASLWNKKRNTINSKKNSMWFWPFSFLTCWRKYRGVTLRGQQLSRISFVKVVWKEGENEMNCNYTLSEICIKCLNFIISYTLTVHWLHIYNSVKQI